MLHRLGLGPLFRTVGRDTEDAHHHSGVNLGEGGSGGQAPTQVAFGRQNERTVMLHGFRPLLGAVGRDTKDLDGDVRVDGVALRAGTARLRQLLPADDLQVKPQLLYPEEHVVT